MRLTLFFLLGLTSVAATAEPLPTHIQEWTFSDYFTYFRSNSNYINGGTSTTSLPQDGTFTTAQDTLAIDYDAFPNVRFSASLGYGYSNANNDSSAFTDSGLTEFSAGAQYWWRHPDWALVPNLKFGYPFYRIDVNNPQTSSALISNAAAWGEGGAWGIFYLRPFAIYGYLGFRYQDGGQSAVMPVDVGASYRFPLARVRIGIRGESTIINDNYTNTPLLRLNEANTVDAGSLKYFSLNPTVFEGYGEFDWIFTREWEAGAGFAQTFYGSNAAQGWTLEAMVRFRLPSSKSQTSDATSSGPQPNFEEDINKYDQTIFDQSKPDQIQTPPPKPKKSIDKMLQDTEKTLEK